jgi:hypothetical protein
VRLNFALDRYVSGQLTRQPSTRTKKVSSQVENEKMGASSAGKSKHSQSKGSPAQVADSSGVGQKSSKRAGMARKDDPQSAHHLDPFLREEPLSSNSKPAFVRKSVFFPFSLY